MQMRRNKAEKGRKKEMMALMGSHAAAPQDLNRLTSAQETGDLDRPVYRQACLHTQAGFEPTRVHQHRKLLGYGRYRHNNTEAFADKYITADDLLHVMRERTRALVEELERKARIQREKVRVAAEKKQEREASLRKLGIELDRAKIRTMTVPQLKAQYDVYKHIVKDETILQTTLVSIPLRQDKLNAVLAALDRYEAVPHRGDAYLTGAQLALLRQSAEATAGVDDVEMGDVEKDEFADEEDAEELYH
ncbi:hypothetical protein R3P38DRAFT_2815663 [Favolaschia claudopus]|uniref:Uncharacterized protein n=1 Tax=Favolaschia claudopus TaxID=2862362 RepID=A0AAV9Z183_9AGAR